MKVLIIRHTQQHTRHVKHTHTCTEQEKPFINTNKTARKKKRKRKRNNNFTQARNEQTTN